LPLANPALHPLPVIAILLLCCPQCQPPQAAADDWPWFLGPEHTGVVRETGLNLDWTRSVPELVWRQSIGTGYSAPSVLGDRLVVHHREDDAEIVSCRNRADGSEVWRYSYPSDFEDPYGYNNGPRCSPILTQEHCFSLGAGGMLTCVSFETGRKIWQVDLRKQFDIPEWFFGVGCSPILDGNQLIVLVGGQPNSGVVSFRATDGEVLWEAVGKQTWDGAVTDEAGDTYQWTGDEMVVSYSSPLIATIHGRRHLLCQMRQGLVSLDPATGAENFHFWFRPRVHESVNAARPLVMGDRIFLSAAYQLGSVMLQVAPDGAGVTVLWRDRRSLQAHWSTPIHVDGFIYGFSGRHENEGELRCIRASDGRLIWQTDGFAGKLTDLVRDRSTGRIIDRNSGKEIPFPYYGRGSMVQAGDRFIVLGERGTLSIVEVNPEKFVEHGRTSFDEISYPAWAAPVISSGMMYLRSEDWLICVSLKSDD
jgi:outer membrane protein assembly factor BamB